MKHNCNTTYPLCRKFKLLRQTTKENLVISTAALWELLGETLYQFARREFQYHVASGPTPTCIEFFLQHDPRVKEHLAHATLELEAAAAGKIVAKGQKRLRAGGGTVPSVRLPQRYPGA